MNGHNQKRPNRAAKNAMPLTSIAAYVRRHLSSLRTRLFIVAVFALVPPILVILSMALQEYQVRKAEIQAETLRLVRMAATEHEREIAAGRRLLLATAAMMKSSTDGRTVCLNGLGNLLDTEAAFNELTLIDHRGTRLCSWPDATTPVPELDIALARQAIEKRQMVVGGYTLEASSGRTEMHLAYPAMTARGDATSALVLSIDLAYFGNSVRNSRLPKGAVIAIWDVQGSVLYRYPEPEKWIAKNIAQTPVVQHILGRNSEGVTDIVGLDGVPRLTAYTPLRLKGINETVYIHIGIPADLVYAGTVKRLALVLSGLALGVLVMLALLAVTTRALLIRPINALVAAARRFGAGDFRTRSGVANASGEIGVLVTVFDDMATKIEERHFELENLKFALDQHAIVSVTDPAGKIIYVNDRFCETSGYAREELIDRSHRMTKSDHHPHSFYRELWDTISSGLVWQNEVCNRRKDGALFWLASTIVPITGPGGELVRYIAIRTDITPLKTMEAALRHSATNFRTLADTISAAVIMHRGGKLLYANRYAELLTGFSNEELLDMEFDEFAHPDWRHRLRALWAARQRGEPVPSRYEYRGNTKDGQERWVEVSGCLAEFEGKPAALITALDITERKFAEDALRHAHDELESLVTKRTQQLAQAKMALEEDVARREIIAAELLARNQQLTELNRRLSEAQNQLLQSEKLASIGQLAAGVAHEINNPIGYVQSNLSSLEKYLHDLLEMLSAYESVEAAMSGSGVALSAQLQERKAALDVDFIKEDLPHLMSESREGIQRVKKIVQDLKDFSRVDNAVEWVFTDLHKCIESTLNIVYNEIKYKADVTKEYCVLPDIECLPSQLNQVFMNLLVNAAHATEGPRGTITLRTGMADESVWIEIADTGKGISPENLKRIFDPFFTTKPVGQGTGLGLSLSYGIVQKHHGRIEVQSTVGHGTTFRITLPLKQPESAIA